jgi:hypothetical protein
MCVNNELVELSCPSGLKFDKILKKCNYANQVICDELTSTTIITATSSQGNKI